MVRVLCHPAKADRNGAGLAGITLLYESKPGRTRTVWRPFMEGAVGGVGILRCRRGCGGRSFGGFEILGRCRGGVRGVGWALASRLGHTERVWLTLPLNHTVIWAKPAPLDQTRSLKTPVNGWCKREAWQARDVVGAGRVPPPKFVGPPGLEPGTHGLKVRCSAS